MTSLLFNSITEKADNAWIRLSQEERRLIEAIAERALPALGDPTRKVFQMVLECKLYTIHAYHHELRLAELLAADDFNFAHDITGIWGEWNDLKMDFNDHWLPRFQKGRRPADDEEGEQD